MRIIKQKDSIAKAQELLQKRFVEASDESITVDIGWKGETVHDRQVYWIAKENIWAYSRLRGNRYRNVFGVGKPLARSSVSIDCLINIPIDGIDRKIAGAYAIDDVGDFYIIHRGKIGGGKEGIGKELFVQQYTGEWDIVEDGDRQSRVVILGSLDDPDLITKISKFVYEVRRIKDGG